MTKRFWLGEIIKAHKLLGYTIIEHHPYKVRGCMVTDVVDKRRRSYDVEPISTVYGTFYEAILAVVAHSRGMDINDVWRFVDFNKRILDGVKK